MNQVVEPYLFNSKASLIFPTSQSYKVCLPRRPWFFLQRTRKTPKNARQEGKNARAASSPSLKNRLCEGERRRGWAPLVYIFGTFWECFVSAKVAVGGIACEVYPAGSFHLTFRVLVRPLCCGLLAPVGGELWGSSLPSLFSGEEKMVPECLCNRSASSAEALRDTRMLEMSFLLENVVVFCVDSSCPSGSLL